MRAMILWAGVVCFSVLGAEGPRFADLRAGDAVVAVVNVQAHGACRTSRFEFQKLEDGMVVSAWNVARAMAQDRLVGRLALDAEHIAHLDETMRVYRAQESSAAGGGRKIRVAFFWQCCGVQREEKIEDTALRIEGRLSLPLIYDVIELLNR